MADWRRILPVFVPDAHALGSIAVIRSLGRAGYPVVAASARSNALGLKSAFAKRGVIAPPYGSPDFMPWLNDTLARERVRAIVPTEGFLHAIRERFIEFAPLMPIDPDPKSTYANLSKRALFERLAHSGEVEHLPGMVFLHGEIDKALENSLRELGYPQYAKFDEIDALQTAGNLVEKLEDHESAMRTLRHRMKEYRAGVVQAQCEGVGVGVFLLKWNGQELAHFMHRRLHEVPHTGGASSYRRAWHHPAILADARKRASQLSYQGVGMFEYKWDPGTDEFSLLELNARFWGSLHLALFSGVDFPRILLDAHFGQISVESAYDTDTHCRQTFPGEIDYVVSCLRDRSLPLSRKLAVVFEFGALSLNPSVHSDYWFPGDRALYFRSLQQTAQKYLSGIFSRHRRA